MNSDHDTPIFKRGVFRGKEIVLRVYSIFKSIQGESSRMGLPCWFVRLAGCPLHCSYCDTREACESSGKSMTIEDVVKEVEGLGPRLVEVTGGEPLAQDETPSLLSALCDLDFEVMLETCGAFSIEHIDPRVRIVMDVKCPGSGMADRMCLSNLDVLIPNRHEVKFVVSSRDDFEWVADLCRRHSLVTRCELLVSPAHGLVSLTELAKWILGSSLPLRLQPQLHRIIWPDGEPEK
ncbi:MAG: radical SAM protein [Proteobacteria bacterium]|nr:radical SAM protein [Pseudomonadota bacterium]